MPLVSAPSAYASRALWVCSPANRSRPPTGWPSRSASAGLAPGGMCVYAPRVHGSSAHELTAAATGSGQGRPIASASWPRAQRMGASGPAPARRSAALWKMKNSRTGPAPNASCPMAQTIGSPAFSGKIIRCGKPASRQNGSVNRSATFSNRPNPSRPMAASRSGGSAGSNRGPAALSTPSGRATTACVPCSTEPPAVTTRTPSSRTTTSDTGWPSRTSTPAAIALTRRR